MKLVVPYIDELLEIDARIIRLANFMGVPCEAFALANVMEPAEFLEKSLSDQCSCFVVNPQVMNQWMGGDDISADLIAFLLSRFSHLLVHGIRVEAFDAQLVVALSRGRLKSVHAIHGEHASYVVAEDSKHICESFAGMSFGPADPSNDHVFCTNENDPAIKPLISLGGRPFMAVVRVEKTQILFLASKDVADLNEAVGDAPLAEYFSRFVPHAMALRYVAGDESWQPGKAQASITIDDPLLQKSYGFLKFESLVDLAEQHNFHTTIAFIPHNFRRNSPLITRIFKENARRLSICFHGNDHTEGEFASTDLALLNTFLRIAQDRMTLHQQTTGLPCDKVMVFPQGNFSIESMKVLKSHNFFAAVNTVPYPQEQPVPKLTIGELAQPAVLRYGGFPLFIRKPIGQTQSEDIAFNLFFGRPVLIGEHHDIFQHPKSLIEIAARINSAAPKVSWSSLETVVSNSILTRRAPDGTHHVRAFSGTVRISNDSDSTRRYSIEWDGSCNGTLVEQVLLDGAHYHDFGIDDPDLRLSVELAPRSSGTFSLIHRKTHAIPGNLGLRWNVQAFLRRRLSELRDNYLSKNQRLLAAARTLQRRFLRV